MGLLPQIVDASGLCLYEASQESVYKNMRVKTVAHVRWLMIHRSDLFLEPAFRSVLIDGVIEAYMPEHRDLCSSIELTYMRLNQFFLYNNISNLFMGVLGG